MSAVQPYYSYSTTITNFFKYNTIKQYIKFWILDSHLWNYNYKEKPFYLYWINNRNSKISPVNINLSPLTHLQLQKPPFRFPKTRLLCSVVWSNNLFCFESIITRGQEFRTLQCVWAPPSYWRVLVRTWFD